MENTRRYKPIKESREGYFIEYWPPNSDERFSKLNIVFIDRYSKREVKSIMEKELKYWLNKYSIPLFVSSFDNKGELMVFPEKKCNHLMGYYANNSKISLYWKLLKNDELPTIALNKDYLEKIFTGYDYIDINQRRREIKKQSQQIRIGSLLIFVWLIMIPVSIEIIKYSFRPIEIIFLIYCLFKAIQQGLILIGRWPKSEHDKEREEEELLKNHYYYHCKRNPEGFRRLFIENIENDEKADILREMKSLV